MRGAIGKVLSGSGAVTTAGKPGLLFGYCLKVGTAALASVTFADGTGSGTARWYDGWKEQTAAGDVCIRHTFDPPIVFSTDIYATLTGTNTALSVTYKELA